MQAKQVVARTALVGLVTALATLVVAYFVWYTPIGRTGVVLVGLLTFDSSRAADREALVTYLERFLIPSLSHAGTWRRDAAP